MFLILNSSWTLLLFLWWRYTFLFLFAAMMLRTFTSMFIDANELVLNRIYCVIRNISCCCNEIEFLQLILKSLIFTLLRSQMHQWYPPIGNRTYGKKQMVQVGRIQYIDFRNFMKTIVDFISLLDLECVLCLSDYIFGYCFFYASKCYFRSVRL